MKKSLIDWLMESSGPIIRYKILKEIVKSTDLRKAEEELLNDDVVRYWFLKMPTQIDFNMFHGSFDTNFENFMGKLVSMGLHAGIEIVDKKTKPYRVWFENELDKSPDRSFKILDPKPSFRPFYLTIVASLLAMAGYVYEPAIQRVLELRLVALKKMSSKKDYNLYIPWDPPHKEPALAKGRPLVNPSLYEYGSSQFPSIHDINGFSTFEDSKEIDDVINYIMTPEYHKITPGYGIVFVPPKHYYSMGWDVMLPGFIRDFNELDNFDLGMLVQRAYLMSHFKKARKSDWLNKAFKHLQSFRNNCGTYSFPKNYLKESSGYWVTGSHMGLGEDRRKRNWIEIESTFWMLKLQQLIDNKKLNDFI